MSQRDEAIRQLVDARNEMSEAIRRVIKTSETIKTKTPMRVKSFLMKESLLNIMNYYEPLVDKAIP